MVAACRRDSFPDRETVLTKADPLRAWFFSRLVPIAVYGLLCLRAQILQLHIYLNVLCMDM